MIIKELSNIQNRAYAINSNNLH